MLNILQAEPNHKIGLVPLIGVGLVTPIAMQS